MPNLSPEDFRNYYALYDNKASLGAESVQGITALEKELTSIGYHIDWSRGDAPHR
jgi:biotin synthase